MSVLVTSSKLVLGRLVTEMASTRGIVSKRLTVVKLLGATYDQTSLKALLM